MFANVILTNLQEHHRRYARDSHNGVAYADVADVLQQGFAHPQQVSSAALDSNQVFHLRYDDENGRG